MYQQIVVDLLEIVNVYIGSDIEVYDESFYKSFLSNPSLTLGEYYTSYKIDISNINQTLNRLMLLNEPKMRSIIIRRLGFRIIFLCGIFINSFISNVMSKIFNLHSIAGSRRVVEIHYDLPNELYRMMLDDNMQYSCAYFGGQNINLNAAQRNKIQMIISKLKIKDGMSIVDIGCGFGMLCYNIAKKYPLCKVYGINISQAQLDWINKEIPKLNNLLYINCDYRNLSLKCNRIVSVGMFEHVGHKNYEVFMNKMNSMLNDKGLLLLHTIANKRTRELGDPWINKYIFPGGRLPSPQEILNASLKNDLLIEDLHNFGLDYASTITFWRERFIESYDVLTTSHPLIFDGEFKRKWLYYLGCCESIFNYKNTILIQMVFTKNWRETYVR
jgi:cyclopropane-fatty-acyl-phospholipid synthase